jgi:hypothetical protein
MANILSNKDRITLRLKNKTLSDLKAFSVVADYPTINTLASDILVECMDFLTDKDRTAMPEILMKLKSLNFSLSSPVQPAPKTQEGPPSAMPFTPYQLAALKDFFKKEIADEAGKQTKEPIKVITAAPAIRPKKKPNQAL